MLRWPLKSIQDGSTCITDETKGAKKTGSRSRRSSIVILVQRATIRRNFGAFKGGAEGNADRSALIGTADGAFPDPVAESPSGPMPHDRWALKTGPQPSRIAGKHAVCRQSCRLLQARSPAARHAPAAGDLLC